MSLQTPLFCGSWSPVPLAALYAPCPRWGDEQCRRWGSVCCSSFAFCCSLFITQLLQHGFLHQQQSLWGAVLAQVSPAVSPLVHPPNIFFRSTAWPFSGLNYGAKTWCYVIHHIWCCSPSSQCLKGEWIEKKVLWECNFSGFYWEKWHQNINLRISAYLVRSQRKTMLYYADWIPICTEGVCNVVQRHMALGKGLK